MADDPWSASLTLKLSPPGLWDLLWRPETQPGWLGPDSAIDLHAGRRCVLRDEAGPWRTATVRRAVRPSAVELTVDGGEVSLTIAADGDGSRLTVTHSPGGEEAGRYWARRLERVRELARRVARRRVTASQAVVVIHGIGEQPPGVTLRHLVASGVLADPGARVFVKPDRLSRSFELRKVAYEGSPDGGFPNTDVFELYWAHLIRDTRLGQVLNWARRLLLRRDVPRPLRPAWLALWGLIVLAAAAAAASALGALPWLTGGAVAIGASLVWRLLLRGVLINVLGDAPRYLVPLPDNIALRQRIREEGVDLIERLHRDGYDRIVVLGHSLGSVIAYDIVTHAWIAMNTAHRRPHDAGFKAASALERRLTGDCPAAEAQELQHAAWRELRANTQPWLVTDLVTVGSPLTYADYLMADGRAAFDRLVADRVLPVCPPEVEVEAKSGHSRVTYEVGYTSPFRPGRATFRLFHHGAPFAVTRWTNLYFKAGLWGLSGDIVGGPLAGLFGPWVRDVELAAPRRGPVHTCYWRRLKAPDEHLARLREALGLRARGDLVRLLGEIPPYALVFRAREPPP